MNTDKNNSTDVATSGASDAWRRSQALKKIWKIQPKPHEIWFKSKIGTLEIIASTDRVVVGSERGFPRNGTRLTVMLCAPEELWAQIEAQAAAQPLISVESLSGAVSFFRNGGRPSKQSLVTETRLGRVDHEDIFVVKKGRGYAGLVLEKRPACTDPA